MRASQQRLFAALGSVVVALVLLPASALAVTGDLTQLAGTAGCVSDTGQSGACVDGTLLDGAFSVVISPDGKSAYMAVANNNVLAVFSRDPATGALTQLAGTAGCVSETGNGGTCADGTGINQIRGVAVSPDSKNVYVTSNNSDAVATFSRDTTTGELTQLTGVAGCVSETGSGGACADGKGLDGAFSLAVSPDGLSVYVVSLSSSAVAVFSRDATTGALTQLASTAGCVSDNGSGGACVDGRALDTSYAVTVSPDSKNVYVAAIFADGVAVFSRDTTTGALTQLSGTAGCVTDTGTGGACTDGNGLNDANGIAISADGKHAYVASSFEDAIAVFTRDPTTGALTQLAGTAGCISEDGSGGVCEDGKALSGAVGVATSPDGASVYVASEFSDGIAIFSRDLATGALTYHAGTTGCVSQGGTAPGTCADGKALLRARSVTVSPDAANVYSASPNSDAVSVFSREHTVAPPAGGTPPPDQAPPPADSTPPAGSTPPTDPTPPPAEPTPPSQRPSTISFKIHRGVRSRVVRTEALVNGKRRLRRSGFDITHITLKGLPRDGRMTIRIVATHRSGAKVVSTRIWKGCVKGEPRVTLIPRPRR